MLDVLIDTDLRKTGNLKKVGLDLDIFAQFSKMSAPLKALDVEASKFAIEWNGRHVD